MLAVICDAHPKGQALCAQAGLLGVLLKWLRSLLPSLMAGGAQVGGRAGQGWAGGALHGGFAAGWQCAGAVACARRITSATPTP